MAVISVGDLSGDLAARLKVRAARHGRSMEAEVRAILTETLGRGEDDRPNLGQAIRERFAAQGGAELDIPDRRNMPRSISIELDEHFADFLARAVASGRCR
ncbi:FitA-like ribbon-helix-helix domain-containing protein [Ornithinimicrobium faecis]|uniref:FitA-like ribbon-helix-helix domain-containing protein n=1 Tax=Ornithinimicrobium faecis TaxID=2934158 RepID=UPI002118833F|nr:toxin-antitoxin system [Ornithinimicrobium sp. HY1745]